MSSNRQIDPSEVAVRLTAMAARTQPSAVKQRPSDDQKVNTPPSDYDIISAFFNYPLDYTRLNKRNINKSRAAVCAYGESNTDVKVIDKVFGERRKFETRLSTSLGRTGLPFTELRFRVTKDLTKEITAPVDIHAEKPDPAQEVAYHDFFARWHPTTRSFHDQHNDAFQIEPGTFKYGRYIDKPLGSKQIAADFDIWASREGMYNPEFNRQNIEENIFFLKFQSNAAETNYVVGDETYWKGLPEDVQSVLKMILIPGSPFTLCYFLSSNDYQARRLWIRHDRLHLAPHCIFNIPCSCVTVFTAPQAPQPPLTRASPRSLR